MNTRVEGIKARAGAVRQSPRMKTLGVQTFACDPEKLAQLLDEDIPYLLAELKKRDAKNVELANQPCNLRRQAVCCDACCPLRRGEGV